jgi:hypothetical protein
MIADLRNGQPFLLALLLDLPVRPREVDVERVRVRVDDEAGEITAVEDLETLGAADVVDRDLLVRVRLPERLRQVVGDDVERLGGKRRNPLLFLLVVDADVDTGATASGWS